MLSFIIIEGGMKGTGYKVFVSNLAFESTWRSLKDHMRKAGDVIRADIFEDDRGRSRGMG
jgi:RNA recognition motif-containing protein